MTYLDSPNLHTAAGKTEGYFEFLLLNTDYTGVLADI